MRVTFFGAVCALWLSAVVSAAPPKASKPSPLMAQAKAIIANRMIDPASLQFRNVVTKTVVRDGQPVTVLCGEYNSKNKMGGYTGFDRFVYEPVKLQGVLSFGPSLEIEFFSANGDEDVSHDPGPAIKAGMNGDLLQARFEKAVSFAKAYLPTCMGLVG